MEKFGHATPTTYSEIRTRRRICEIVLSGGFKHESRELNIILEGSSEAHQCCKCTARISETILKNRIGRLILTYSIPYKTFGNVEDLKKPGTWQWLKVFSYDKKIIF